MEPLNRGVWAVNRGILHGVLQPTSRVYRTIVPTRARQSISDFTRNITYPGRVVNHMLQGRWEGAGDESLRFLANTTVGIGGLFDVASEWDIPKSPASFGQTFTRWGWQPKAFIMLPARGPSDPPNLAGSVADAAAEPWRYFGADFNYASAGSTYNKLSEVTEPAAQFSSVEADPYVGVKAYWTYASKDARPNWQVTGQPDPSTLQTLGVALVQTQDPKFIERAHTMSVRMSSTGRSMKFNYWLQKEKAPLVYISPGMGSHRLSSVTLAVAEMAYQAGFSVVATTAVFHPEFMENASTAPLPAYPPVDCRDMLAQITDFDKALERRFPGRFGERALVGLSLGGFQTLYLAARENLAEQGLIRFDRYVAIDPPVNLRHGVEVVDSFYEAPEEWPADQRQANVNNAVHKVAGFGSLPAESTGAPPFSGTESKFLVGMSFRLTLRDTIFSSQSRNNTGVLQTPISQWRREPVYQEIMQYSFREYVDNFALPYCQQNGISRDQLSREINLRTYQKQLRSDSKIRVIVNEDDFLLTSGDISWLRSTFGSRITVLPNGGHLGNLASQPVRSAIITSLDGMK